MSIPEARTGTPDPTLDEAEFRRRFLQTFQDPVFEPLTQELQRIADAAWDAYSHHRKSPRTRKAGPGFADPDYDLAVDWIAAKEAIDLAQRRHEDPNGPARFLLISSASRSEHTCPGEMSKTYRLVEIARQVIASAENVGSKSWSSAAWPLSTDVTFTLAKPASRHPPRSVTGPAPAIPITPSGRRRTG